MVGHGPGLSSPPKAPLRRSVPLALLPLIGGCTESAVDPDSGTAASVRITAAEAVPHPVQPSLLVVSWTQDTAGPLQVAYAVDGDDWRRSPAAPSSEGAHTIVLAGLPYGSETTWHLVDADGTPVTADFLTENGPLPDGLPLPEVGVADAGGWDAEGAPYLFLTIATGDFGAPWWRVIYDRLGRPVWSNQSDPERSSLHARVAGDGRSLYLDQNSFWSLFDAGQASTVQQTLLDGTVVHTFATPGLHHPFTDRPDGTVAYGAVSGLYAQESLTVVDRAGTAVSLWDCEGFLERVGSVGRCGSNALNYDAASDRYLFSFYSVETVVEIDAATGAEQRWFGAAAGSYGFADEADRFWWQHGAIVTNTGTLLLSSDDADDGTETVVREYTIDDEGGVLREIWSFGVGDAVYAEQMGEAVRLPNGNTWHNYGRDPRLREATPAGEVVWDLQWEGTAIGRTMPVVDLYALLPAPY